MGGPIVGIDLGTTNSLVGFCDAQGPRVLESEGRRILPSVVRYEILDGGQWRTVVGEAASEGAVEHPLSTISSAKRLMGRSLADARDDLAYLGYRVVEGENGQARIAVPASCATGGSPGGGCDTTRNLPTGPGQRLVTPQEVSAEILRELRRIAGDALGEDVSRAVVTVPAYFDDAQRQATRDAGRLAGLEVVRIVNEPTAAALAYGLGLDPARGARTIAVYDFGGGTFDVSILKIIPAQEEGEPAIYQVISTAGDTHLGGDDIDHEIVRMFAEDISQIRERDGLDPVELMDMLPKTRRALVGFARLVKHRLSEEQTARVDIIVDERLRYGREISREDLEHIMSPIIDRTLRACERAIADAARKGAASVDAVVLVGGSTRIPLVRARVGEAFGIEPYTALDPDEVVALGASVQASILAGSSIAATGASALLLDVIPLSLGIETVGGAVAKLVTCNSAVPARATEMFSTSVDGQAQIKLHVVQGEREMVADCRSLGLFILKVPPMPAGVPQIEVEFLVDANGVLNVSAIERRSERQARLQVIPNHGLTREEVERIEGESLEHARDDMARHRVVDLIANSRLDLKWVGERLERFRDELENDYALALQESLEALSAMVASADGDWRSVDPDVFYRTKQDLDELSVRLQEIAIARTLGDR